MESLHAMRTLRASAPHPGESPHVVPQQPDLPHREPETEAGTHMDLPNCGPGMTGTCALPST